MNEQSIRNLKNKFLVISMLSFITVMVVVGGLIYVGTLVVSRREAHEVTQTIVDNGGSLPSVKTVIKNDQKANNTTASGNSNDDSSTVVSDSPQDNINYFLKTMFGTRRNVLTNKDQWYATRYFSVILDNNDNFIQVKADRIASIDMGQAKQYAKMVSDNAFKFGSVGNYYYQVEKQKHRTLVVFVDCTQQIGLTNRILYMALILLGFGSIVSFLVLRAFSYRAIAPEIKNVEQQKQFITNASHELKTPLAVIKANTQVQEMIGGKDEWTESTMRQVDRMTGLIQNLVTIVRAEEKEDTGDRIDTDISAAIRDTVKSYLPVAENAGETLNQNIGDGIYMKAVESQIRQLATLLIDNAIKYCDDHGTIDVVLLQKGKGIRLQVSNSYANGKNVDYSKFFERFYRADESHNVDKGGYGIGLSIAESLVKQYNGTINVSWKDGIITFDCILKG
ncbi:MAG: sensor histidine kinase [Lachnospiraceae bacterium]|uniref:histidine kinase n=1 Tax=Candidatus Weimeria bifida TaxID=2599074 RepID=A0A6N7J0D5_9FIRM|nr:HAMP domain-containing histidine kinase [Candidatus Weimeria bifida]RRF96815.1 MAG: sensor histidine kinase [Lachnospiraceae bacterium]